MKRNYLGIWALLATAFVATMLLSAFSPVNIAGYELRDSGLYGALTSPPDTTGNDGGFQAVEVQSTGADSVFDTALAQHPAPVDTTSKVLLFIGDSMLEGLSPRMAAYAAENGHTLYSVMWYSSTTEVWGRSGKLKAYINRLKPDFIFISLGANELFVKDIEQRRDKYVKKMLEEIGDIPYLWIGPPNWKPDTGINRLIAKNAAPGSFFLSDGMHFDRASDGAHPTRSSAIVWLDSVMRWMPAHVAHPFRMDVPQARTARPARIFIHQPGEQ